MIQELSTSPTLSQDPPMSAETAPAAPAPTMLVPAKRWDRWVAALIDDFLIGLILIPIFFLFMLLLNGGFSFTEEVVDQVTSNPYFLIIGTIIYFAYKIGYLIRDQATPGKKWRKMKVIRFSDGAALSPTQATIRELSTIMYNIPVIGTLVYILSASRVMFTPLRRAYHDSIANSFVVQDQTAV
ncbi:MAG: hypothetical protein QG639_277 [Patescibacteria group bacterium]|nr:hypothetical protein [Patescibacteria group bacterium]